ncbi:protein CURVATURE THYLAKOID 1A, chloroplastic [Cicer arietinum]|uniref:Protein CURVATURE THYLAKOID 1A, chloroplastic n=1 Tax=Cicer arietinum TaxID=3827 RepID=A0A1S2XUM9_CICAR|nr:protein CURVATURE THYLAKOID 1A, chloroplastic [Cicer arietinum]
MAVAASTSTVLVPPLPRLLKTNHVTRCSALPYLPPRLSTTHSSSSSSSSSPFLKHFSEPRKFSLHQTRASSSDETSTSLDANELFSDLKEKWDGVENKSTVLVYGGGALVAVWLSSILVGAINSVPLLPKIMELVGLGYTGWFVYRYLLFKSSRKELATDIEVLKKKIAGTE